MNVAGACFRRQKPERRDTAAFLQLPRSPVWRVLRLDEASTILIWQGQATAECGGRREIADCDTTLVSDLQRLAEPATMGDPMRPLKWVSKSPAKLAAVLCQAGHAVCANTVAKLLETRLGYSRQVNRKTHEGTNHPDRDAQFEHISTSVLAAQTAGQPVILNQTGFIGDDLVPIMRRE